MTNYVSLGKCWDWLQKRYVFSCRVVADVLPLRLKNWLKLIAYSKHTWQFEMNIYTHFKHFLLLHTHIIHIFSMLYLNKLLDNLVFIYAHGIKKPKNDDKK